MKTLTRRQMDVFRFIVAYWNREAMAPSFKEIAAALGLSSEATVHQHIGELEDKGYIGRSPHESRSIKVLDPNYLTSCPLCGHERAHTAQWRKEAGND